MNGRFTLNRRDSKLLGVASGLADLTGIDALLIRLALIALTLVAGPLTIVFYVLTAWLASNR